jgi:DNA-3-methyladenine glycosylase I
MVERCPWCGTDPQYVAYHDVEWGVPQRESRALFETLTLEAFQAGLAWITILRKREGFRARFEGFDPDRLAFWGEAEIAAALADPGVVRHRGKTEAAVANARAWRALEAETGFARFLWDFVDGRPIQNAWRDPAQAPAETPLSREISRALRARGFRFCGPTTVYAFMQAAGLVNDHLVGCWRREPVAALG